MTARRRHASIPAGLATRARELSAALMAVLALAACSDDAPASAGASGGAVTSDLLQSRESIAEDARSQMSLTGQMGQDSERWIVEHLPDPDVDFDTLGFTLGDPDAPLQMVEFSDFGCGYCRQFHLETFPTLREEYIETGKLSWQYVPMLLGIFPNAIEAALVGECIADEADFTAGADLLFERQADWKRASDPDPIFREIATAAGADADAVMACVEAEENASRIAAGTAFAANAGVRGTPTMFLVDHTRIPGAIPLDLFRQVLDTAYSATVSGNEPE